MFRFDPRELSDASGETFVHERTVKFQDVDAAQIVFYPRVLEYFHDAYVGFLAHVGVPLHQVLDAKEWAAPIRHAEAQFFRPMRFGDDIDVALVKAHLTESSVTIGFRASPSGKSEALAVGQSEHVFVDRKTFKRIDVPPRLEAAFKKLGAA